MHPQPKSYRLNYSQMLQFVGLYRDRPELWDPGHPAYKDRPGRIRGLQEIAGAMALPGFGPREVANKIKNLRTTFRQEKKKVLRSEQVACSPDQLYRPRLVWYNMVDGFLGKSGLRHYDVVDSSTAGEQTEAQDELLECSMEVKSEGAWPGSDDGSSLPDPPQQPPPVAEDEFDFFARSLAVQLRKLPLQRALPAMERLLAVVREERLADHRPNIKREPLHD